MRCSMRKSSCSSRAAGSRRALRIACSSLPDRQPSALSRRHLLASVAAGSAILLSPQAALAAANNEVGKYLPAAGFGDYVSVSRCARGSSTSRGVSSPVARIFGSMCHTGAAVPPSLSARHMLPLPSVYQKTSFDPHLPLIMQHTVALPALAPAITLAVRPCPPLRPSLPPLPTSGHPCHPLPTCPCPPLFTSAPPLLSSSFARHPLYALALDRVTSLPTLIARAAPPHPHPHPPPRCCSSPPPPRRPPCVPARWTTRRPTASRCRPATWSRRWPTSRAATTASRDATSRGRVRVEKGVRRCGLQGCWGLERTKYFALRRAVYEWEGHWGGALRAAYLHG